MTHDDHSISHIDAPPPEPGSLVAPAAVPTARARRGPPWWVWLIVGGVALIALMVVSAVLVFMGQKNKSLSPDYSGAPVEASDAVGTTAVSVTATVAYDRPAEWVELADYIDLSPMTSGLPAGIRVNGAHFTGEPGVDVPQLVMLYEGDPGAGPLQSLTAELEDFVDGVKESAPDIEASDPEPYSTSNGLDGYRIDYSATVEGFPTENAAVMVGHGRRVVIVQWTSYEGPIDEAGLLALTESLRVDE